MKNSPPHPSNHQIIQSSIFVLQRRVLSSVLIAVLALALRCRGAMYNDVSVTAVQRDAVAMHGYVECRFVVQNNHPSEAREVRLAMGDPAGYETLHEVARTVRVEPGARVECELWAPPWAGYLRRTRVTIDGVPQEETIETYVRRHFGTQPMLLVSRGLNRDDVEKKLYPRKGGSSPYSTIALIARADDDVAQWPATWLSYTPYDGIMLHEREWRELPERVAAALRAYVYAGGMLCVLGTNRLPAWGLVRTSATEITGAWHVLQGNVACAGGAYGWAGFGMLLAVPYSNPTMMSSNLVNYLRTHLRLRAEVWDLPGSVEEVHQHFPLLHDMTVPFRWLTTLSLLFALAIGPLNLFVLHRLNKRIWLLWTTPTLAAVATVGVVLYALLSEGTRPLLRLTSVTLLDQSRHEAVMAGLAGYYFPMVPGEGFLFERTTELSPASEARYRGQSTGVMLMDWTRGQAVAGRLVRARIPLYLRQRSVCTRRERMVFTPRGDGMDALNGLGAHVTCVWYADARGDVWYASNIAAGASARLARTEPAPPGSSARLVHVFSEPWQDQARLAETKACTYLEPRMYLAVLADDPFVDIGYRGPVRARQAYSVVIGFTDGADDE